MNQIKQIPLRVFLIGVFFLIPFSSFANQSILNKYQDKKFWLSDTWLKLIHYKKGFLSNSYKSDISSPEFFLAENGSKSPQLEFQATFLALLSSQQDKVDAHAQCRFPARFLWFKEQLLKEDQNLFPNIDCPKLKNWSLVENVESISIMFATGYFSNPASFFGHPLIKFNTKKNYGHNYLLDKGINYGAHTPKDPNPIVYVIKGLFGGYTAGYSSNAFHHSNHNYTELELRDMWEYHLRLSPKQKAFMIAHLWELQNMKFPYYFFSDNCGYRIAELLELVTGYDINPKYMFYSIPHYLYDRIVDLNLVERVTKIDSRATRMNSRYQTLNNSQQKLVKKIVDNHQDLNSPQFNSLMEENKIKVLETLINYYSFRSILGDKKKYEQRRKEYLYQRSLLPSLNTNWKETPSSPPHLGQNPTSFSLGAFHDQDLKKSGLAFRVRPAYYDLLSPDKGRYPDSELRVSDLRIKATDKKIWIESLELFSITSLNISKTSLPGDGGYAWKLQLGFIERDNACLGCLSFRFDGGAGLAKKWGNHLSIYGLVGPWLQTKTGREESLAFNPHLGLLLTPNEELRVGLSFHKPHFINGEKSKKNRLQIETRLGSSKYWDVSLLYSKEIYKRYSLSTSYYW